MIQLQHHAEFMSAKQQRRISPTTTLQTYVYYFSMKLPALQSSILILSYDGAIDPKNREACGKPHLFFDFLCFIPRSALYGVIYKKLQ